MADLWFCLSYCWEVAFPGLGNPFSGSPVHSSLCNNSIWLQCLPHHAIKLSHQVNIFLGCSIGLFISDFISILIFPSVSSQLPNKSIWQLVFPSFIQEGLYSPENPSPSTTDLHSMTQITPTSQCCTWLKYKFI